MLTFNSIPALEALVEATRGWWLWAGGLAFTLGLLQLVRTWWSMRHIPGPLLASITNLPRVWWVKTGRAHLYHQALHAKYGDVVRIGPRMVSFSNPEAIPTVYPIRPGFLKSDFYAVLRPYTRDRGSMLAVFNTQDELTHKLIKNPIAPLFSLSNVVHFEGLVEEVLACLSKQLDKRFVATGEVFDCAEWLQYFAFDVMGTISFSKRYGFLEQGRDVNGMLAAIFQFFMVAAPMTQVTWLDPILYKNRLVHSFRQTPGMSILGFVGKVIGERLAREGDVKEGSGTTPRNKDFLARFLEIQNLNPKLPPWVSTAWIFSNVIAGSDTVGTVMKTAIIDYLLSHPASFERLQRELDGANVTQPYPQWKEVRDLPYLDACIQEAARLHPPFALPFERIVPRGGVTVLGHYLTEGTLVGGNPYVVNRHEATFGPDVEAWKPERWLSGDDGHKKRLEQGLLTFGAGRRVCLGKHIGIFEMKKLLPFLILNYKMQLVDSKPFTMENGFFFKQRGFDCQIQRRGK
ncbi:putative cytochrome P450 oxidoreductase [Aspergillus sclerotiicarbonarius CBS 121057]|uniref:Putative cytochrome P450 oxidoreductase n=1 Tax=Aspergillus sclerotiicarbonarius (strain CBS 121057 / IBT 28362) TaxID=1448318 RepID=A0A319DV99_ASPSB|nr:putative cytochrome P450 oxidoreductase [Aspergillus sclerotiicarbonarius CBS 121057]